MSTPIVFQILSPADRPAQATLYPQGVWFLSTRNRSAVACYVTTSRKLGIISPEK
jgi:hypothetical protein